jgi:hypothetical protein
MDDLDGARTGEVIGAELKGRINGNGNLLVAVSNIQQLGDVDLLLKCIGASSQRQSSPILPI